MRLTHNGSAVAGLRTVRTFSRDSGLMENSTGSLGSASGLCNRAQQSVTEELRGSDAGTLHAPSWVRNAPAPRQ